MVLGVTNPTYANVPQFGIELNNRANKNKDNDAKDLDVEEPDYIEADQSNNVVPTYAVPRKVSEARPNNTVVEMEGEGEGDGGDGKQEPVQPEKDPNEKDSEKDFGRLIVEGDTEKLELFLSENGENEQLILGHIQTEKIGQALHDHGVKDFPCQISAIDLAILCQRESALETLLEHCIDSYPSFPHYLRCRSSLNPGLLIQKLSSVKSSSISGDANVKAVEETLNVHLDSNHDSDERIRKRDLILRLDLSAFHRSDQNRETLALLPMIIEENKRERLLKHPVTQTFISVKWHKLRCLFFSSILYMITLAILATLSSCKVASSVLPWVTFSIVIPLMFTTAIHILSKSGDFISSSYVDFVKISIPHPSFKCCLRLLLIASAIGSISSSSNVFQALFVFSSWLEAFAATLSLPSFAFHSHAIIIVIKEGFKTFFMMLFVFLSLMLSLFVLTGDFSTINFFPATYLSYLQMRSMFLANRVFDNETYVKSPFMVLLLLACFAYAILVFSTTSSKSLKLLKNKRDLEMIQIVKVLDGMEALTNALGIMTRRCALLNYLPDVSSSAKVAKAEDDGVFKAYPEKRRSSIGRNETFSLVIPATSKSMDDVETRYDIPMSVWHRARPIAEELHDQIRARVEFFNSERRAQLSSRDMGDYTSLYWNPGDSCKSENEYEIVGDLNEDGDNGRGNSFLSCLGGVRAMRESLLRELRRDIAKLVSSGNNKEKSVSVRPGLALGVIALQAGAAKGGPKLVLQ